MLKYPRIRVLKEECFWDVFNKFINKGMVIRDTEKTLQLSEGYIRSVKSTKSIPKFNTFKKISDYLRMLQRISVDKYGNIITADELQFIIDLDNFDKIIKDRNLTAYKLAELMKQSDSSNKTAERLNYWKNKDPKTMTLRSLHDFEEAIKLYDDTDITELKQKKTEEVWDFYKERQHYVTTGKLLYPVKKYG
jgi:hypothetical protein